MAGLPPSAQRVVPSFCAPMTSPLRSRSRPSCSLIGERANIGPPCALERDSAEPTVHLVSVDATLFTINRNAQTVRSNLSLSL